jgi:hypothetical protein
MLVQCSQYQKEDYPVWQDLALRCFILLALWLKFTESIDSSMLTTFSEIEDCSKF